MKNEAKNILRSRTFWLNVLVLLIGIFEYLNNNQSNATLLGLIAVANIILRAITTKPVKLI